MEIRSWAWNAAKAHARKIRVSYLRSYPNLINLVTNQNTNIKNSNKQSCSSNNNDDNNKRINNNNEYYYNDY